MVSLCNATQSVTAKKQRGKKENESFEEVWLNGCGIFLEQVHPLLQHPR